MSNRKDSISKNTSITFLTQLIMLFIGIATSIIIARVLGPKGKGIYALIILIPTIILKLGSLGIEAANVYFTGSKKYEIKDIASNSLMNSIFLGLILIIIFYILLHFSFSQKFINLNQINSIYLWLTILTVPFSLFISFTKNILLGKRDIIDFNKVNIFQTSAMLVLITVFLLILNQSTFGAIISYILSIIVTFFYIFLLIKRITAIKLSYRFDLLKESIRYGLKAYFGNLAQFLNYRLDMFLVAIFLGPAAVGYYSISVGIAEKLWMLPGSIATVLFPKISSIKNKEANRITPKIARHTFFIMIIISLMLLTLVKPLIEILFGSAFLPSVMPLLILLPGIIALGGAKTLTADLAGRGKPQFGTYAAFVSLAVNIPLNLWLIPRWGISGAAFASSVAYIIATIIVVIAFVRISHKSYSEVLLIKKKDFQDYKRIFIKTKGRI